MQPERISRDDVEQGDPSDNKSRAFKTIEERLGKRRRRASLGKLISYIIALIGVILLMLWIKRAGM